MKLYFLKGIQELNVPSVVILLFVKVVRCPLLHILKRMEITNPKDDYVVVKTLILKNNKLILT